MLFSKKLVIFKPTIHLILSPSFPSTFSFLNFDDDIPAIGKKNKKIKKNTAKLGILLYEIRKTSAAAENRQNDLENAIKNIG